MTLTPMCCADRTPTLETWQAALCDRLLAARTDAGAWGYRAAGDGAAEPTALAALALSRVQGAGLPGPRGYAPAPGDLPESGVTHRGPTRPELRWLAQIQQPDGGVPVSASIPSPQWPTALALLAWLRQPDEFAGQIQRATAWLLTARGEEVTAPEGTYGHDTSLVAWPWVAGTHSWIEPTAYAILALRAAGRGDHARVREGIRLVLDRALPNGGWNYGNKRVLASTLRPFPANTGMALAALACEAPQTAGRESETAVRDSDSREGSPPLVQAGLSPARTGRPDDTPPRTAAVERAIAYLHRELPRIRAPFSLAWGLIGLRAWNALPDAAEQWLAEAAGRLRDAPSMPHYDALLLLAAAPRCPLLPPAAATEDNDA